jgi:glycosyltransferase involved in cell wall biosynthesis
MTPPRVSVVLCVYNQADYLPEAMGSILGQTLTDLELIVVDDGSTDSSPEVIHRFTDPRIRYVRNERNLGHASSLNRGCALARGRYLAIMDSDDISLPERLARQADFLDAHPDVAMCGSWVETFGARTEVRRFPTEPAALAVHLLLSCPFSTPTVMLRQAATMPGGFDFDRFGLAFDYACWVDVANRAPVANLPEVLLKYRLHAGQTTVSRRAAQLAGTRLVLRRQLEALLGEVSEAELDALMYVFVNEVSDEPPTAAIGWLFARLRRANRQRRRYDPALLDALLAEKWAHIVTAHEPAVGAMWGQAVRHPALWSWALGRDAIRRTLRPFKPWFWKQRPA